jgi:hypothetical protein
MLKVKTLDTETLEELIERIRSCEGVGRTETMVVLSTQAERFRIALSGSAEVEARVPRRGGGPRGRRAAP